jgi:hypothetical protein
MPDYTITIPEGEQNNGLVRDAKLSRHTPEELLIAWLKPNLQESARRYTSALADRTKAAFDAADDKITVGEVRATIADPKNDEPPIEEEIVR